jgi:hypothetical protein
MAEIIDPTETYTISVYEYKDMVTTQIDDGKYIQFGATTPTLPESLRTLAAIIENNENTKNSILKKQ